ncbi:MAG: hypothetical protein HY731_04585 [Candidatus Tectomicrobia bacterium]|nr:hypothetical protein [Candidatus Tectomicrobia bacterium]
MVLAFAIFVTMIAAGCTGSGGGGFEAPEAANAAHDLISNAKYTRLVVEIHAVPGSEPHDMALIELENAVAENTAKGMPEVVVKADLPARGQDYKYRWSEVEALERKHRQGFASGLTIWLSILYLDGGSEADNGDELLFGAAYGATSLVMFKGNIRKITVADGTLISTQPEIRFVERAVLVHELGHALGLVNNGIAMVTPHEDANHLKHSVNRDSVMYWAVESSELLNIFTRGSDIPYQFDSNDKADMSAARDD